MLILIIHVIRADPIVSAGDQYPAVADKTFEIVYANYSSLSILIVIN